MASPPKRVYMREMAGQIGRSSHTIRGWERDGLLSKSLLPKRDDKGWRYWSPSQIERIKLWMRRNGMAPGKGLQGFSPSPERVQEMLTNLRRPRNIELVQCPHCKSWFKGLAAHIRRAHPGAVDDENDTVVLKS